MAELEGARQAGHFKVICILPDMCKTPGCKQPVPYQIAGDFKDGARHSPDVNFMGYPAMTMNSRVDKVTGNEPGSNGGVKSFVNTDHCAPLNGSKTVRVNGYEVLFQDATYMWMNCDGPDGPCNTIGKVLFIGETGQAETGQDDQESSTDPPVTPETAAEKSFLDELNPSNVLKNLTSPQGIMSLALMAPSLATVDWSDPGSILGAAGGLAGAGGMGTLAQTAGLANQAHSLANTDFSNPGSILGAASTIAGLGSLAGGNSAGNRPPAEIKY